MTTPAPAPLPQPPPLPPEPEEKRKKDAPPMYVCPLQQYLAEVRRIAFGEGARWAWNHPPGPDLEQAAREYAERSR